MNKMAYGKIAYGSMSLVLALALASCSWVELKPEAHKVRVLSQEEVEPCKRLGKTTVSVKSSVAGVPRKQSVMARELEKLARNSALNLNGDTVVPVTEIVDGEQSFDIYRCVGTVDD